MAQDKKRNGKTSRKDCIQKKNVKYKTFLVARDSSDGAIVYWPQSSVQSAWDSS